MTKTILSALVIFLISAQLSAQIIDSLNYGPEPVGGITKLALVYYKIDFSDEQRKKLEDIELEFIYSVDKEGNPALEEVNGVDDLSILDSLKTRTSELPKFYPRMTNGIAQNSIFFMKLQFPRYSTEEKLMHYRYKKPTLEDFEYIRKSGRRMDILIGGVVNGFAGNAQEYLGLGGGMKMDLIYSGKRGVGAGICMNFYGNKLKKSIPLIPWLTKMMLHQPFSSDWL